MEPYHATCAIDLHQTPPTAADGGKCIPIRPINPLLGSVGHPGHNSFRTRIYVAYSVNSIEPATHATAHSASQPPHVLIVDDHTLVTDMLELFLSQGERPLRVSKAVSVPQALALVRAEEGLNLVLLDLHIPDMDGFAGLRNIRHLRPDLPVVIMSGDTSLVSIQAARDGGARGYVRKTAGGTTILKALRQVLDGAEAFPADTTIADGALPASAPYDDGNPLRSLSPREHDVLTELLSGKSNKEIARTLGVELVTVSMHLTHIYRKLKVTNRTQAVRLGLDLAARRLDA